MIDELNQPAPEFDVTEWFNSGDTVSLASLRGRVVVIYAFQMLCPGCVVNATPLAKRVHERLSGPDLAVVGVHMVFEHHNAMTPVSLAAYLHEFAVTFPVGVDRHDTQGVPQTMSAYAMRGTPTFVLVDRTGKIRRHAFGMVDELTLGVELGTLLAEPGDG